jgi:VWFA-related protein
MRRTRRCQRLILAVFLLSIPFSLAQGRSASRPQESQTFTYRSSVSEVRLVFFATDEHNRNVQDLRKDDFAIVDNERVIRDFSSFTRSTAIKLEVIVLLDSSESVFPHFKMEMKEILQLLSNWKWSPDDDVSVLSFDGTESHSVCAGDCGQITSDRIASLPKGGATPLFDALSTATSLLSQRRQPDVWPVIILFSDGDDTVSKASFHDVLEKVMASGAQVYAIDVGGGGRPSHGTMTLRVLANDSGGRYVELREGALRIFNEVMDDLHSGLLVTYPLPESRSGFHSIRILPTHNLNLQFRCRRGYYHHAASGN